jgi:hypothetical protein
VQTGAIIDQLAWSADVIIIKVPAPQRGGGGGGFAGGAEAGQWHLAEARLLFLPHKEGSEGWDVLLTIAVRRGALTGGNLGLHSLCNGGALRVLAGMQVTVSRR